MKFRTRLTTKSLLKCSAAVLLGSSAHAAITVQDSYTAGNSVAGTTNIVDSTTATFTVSAAELGLSATSSDKLVVGFSQRRNQNFTVTYNGGSMLPTSAYLVSGGTNDGAAGIFYLDTFTLGGDLVITTTGNSQDFNGGSLFVFVLSGTADGGPTDFDISTKSDKSANSGSVTTGAGGGFVIGAMGINGSGGATSITGGTIALTTSGQSTAAAWNDGVSGTYTLEFDNNNDSTVAMAAFAPVPEPGSLGLLGLSGGLLVLRRRRKA